MTKELYAAPPCLNDRKVEIQKKEMASSPEAAKRKERSDSLLRSQGIPVNQYLPVIETEAEAKRRTTEEVAYRALALLTVALKGEGLEQPVVEKLVKDYQLNDRLSPNETAFIQNESPRKQELVNFTWRYEAAWTLLWALGYIESLEKPDKICDVAKAVGIMKARAAKQFISDARLRPLSEILDQADLIYRYHWAVVDARINNKPALSGIEPGVVMERHYALNWLIGYMDQEWDDISTDT